MFSFAYCQHLEVAMCIFRGWIVLILILSHPLIARGLVQLSFQDIESKAIAYRLENCKIGNAAIEFLSTREGRNDLVQRYEIAFSGEDLRFDRFFPDRKSDGKWLVRSKSIISDGHLIEDCRVSGEDIPVTIHPFESYSSARQKSDSFHPLSLGFSYLGLTGLSTKGLRTLLGRSDITDKSVSIVQVSQEDIYRLQCTTAAGATATIDVSPNKGFNVLGIKVKLVQDDQEYVQSTVSTLKLWEPSGIWYPSQCDYSMTINQEEFEREVISVERVIFGEVDHDAFKIENLGLDAGRMINDFRPNRVNKNWIWDGNNGIDEVQVEDSTELLTAKPEKEGRNLFLWGNAVVCIFLAAIILFQRFRRPS